MFFLYLKYLYEAACSVKRCTPIIFFLVDFIHDFWCSSSIHSYSTVIKVPIKEQELWLQYSVSLAFFWGGSNQRKYTQQCNIVMRYFWRFFLKWELKFENANKKYCVIWKSERNKTTEWANLRKKPTTLARA